MSWAGLATNQTVSFTNLQNAVTTGYFYAIATITPSSEQITKADASSLVSIDTAYAPFAAKTSNQLVVKSDLKPIFQFSGTFYYNFDPKGWFGWNTSGNACSNYSGASSVTVNWNGSLTNGTVVFIPNCTLDLSSLGFYVIVYAGVAYWLTFSYQYFDATTNTCAYSVTSIGSCATSWSNAVYGNDFFNICFETPQTVYTSSSTIGVGTIIYLDAALTTVLGSADYISIPSASAGLIWNIALFTGQITGDTGSTC